LAALYETAVATGIRQGELLGLRWSDVDLDAARVIVRHTLRLGVRTLGEPKSDASKRTLHLGSLAVTLRAHRTAQLEERMAAGRRWHNGDYVLATKLGEPPDMSTATRAFQGAFARAGLPKAAVP
jgi:integrase